MTRPIVSPKTSVAEAEGRLSKNFGFGRLYSASVIVCKGPKGPTLQGVSQSHSELTKVLFLKKYEVYHG